MLVENLLEHLQKIPKGTNVCIYDWRKNLGDDIGEGSSEGIYADFEISMVNLEAEEAEFFKEQHDKEFTPWLAISFENVDYNDDGKYLVAD